MSNKRIDLFAKFPFLKRLVKMRSFQFLVILPNFVLFFLFILNGIFGTPVGNRNMIIVFVWILWWFMLIAVMVPFMSRIWCMVCPIPAIGEWIQRLALIKVRFDKSARGLKNRLFGLKRRWPRPLRNIWLQNIGFLFLATFSALLVTRPMVSVIVLGGMIIIALILSLIFRLRTFCMYLCPVSGFLGLYSMTSTLELRAKDKEVCKEHKEKECIRGSENGYGCPWFQYTGNMERNNYCGLCMECVKSCPKDNITLNLRPFCSDVQIEGYDEAWKAFIMLTLAFVYSITLMGPWGWIKDWANVTETGNWKGFLIYAGSINFTALALFPAIYLGFIRLAKVFSKAKEVSLKELFIGYSYTLVPFGLLAWIAFSVPLIMVNGAYIISVISDPFGWGWNLFGSAGFQWQPVYPEWVPYIQIVLLMIGLYYSIRSGYRVGKRLFNDRNQIVRSLIPLTVMLTAITIGLLRLYVG